MICKKLMYNEVNQKSGLKPEKIKKNSKIQNQIFDMIVE